MQDGIPKTVSALDSGTPPDVAYIDVYDFQVAGKWAYEGRLEDLSDILTPMKSAFLPGSLETTYLYNDKAKKQKQTKKEAAKAPQVAQTVPKAK